MENVLRHTPCIQTVSSALGFNLVAGTQNTYNAFFFVELKDWDKRKGKAEQYDAIKQSLQLLPGTVRNGLAFSITPPAIPGVGASGGVTFVLEDYSSSQSTDYLASNTDRFIAAAQKRPEIAMALTTALPHVPQINVEVESGQGYATGRQPERCISDDADLHGRLPCQLL